MRHVPTPELKNAYKILVRKLEGKTNVYGR
jgi:hypothetical protein